MTQVEESADGAGSGVMRAGPSGIARRALSVLVGLEWLAVLAAAPILTFPTVRPEWTAAALCSLVVLWLLRWAVRGEPWPLTPFNGALLVFMLMVPVGIWASAFREVTTPLAARLLLGLAAFRATALAVRDGRALDVGLAVFCLLGLALAAVGVLGVRWPGKAAALGALTQHIPRIFETLPEDQGTPGINPNHLAGGLVLYLPLALGLVVRSWRRVRPVVLRVPAALAAVAFLAIIGTVLLASQSRSAWIGAAAGLGALLVLAGVTTSRGWVRVATVGLTLLAVGAATVVVLAQGVPWGAWAEGEIVFDAGSPEVLEDVVGRISLAGRMEIWSRALYVMQDFPFTGCGLGAFSKVVPILYPLFRVAPNADVGHAHNIFLQTAADVGLPGLIAYIAVLMVAGALCWRAARDGDGATRAAAVGLTGALVALHAYGLTDAMALGTKPAVVFWIALGLIAGLGRVSMDDAAMGGA